MIITIVSLLKMSWFYIIYNIIAAAFARLDQSKETSVCSFLKLQTFKWEDYIRWQQKLNEAKASTAALKAGISGLNSEGKPRESKWKAFFRRSRLEDMEPVSKNNIYDKGFLGNIGEIIFPLSSRPSFSQAKSKAG